MKISVDKITGTLTEALQQTGKAHSLATYLLLDKTDVDRYKELLGQINNLYCYLESQREMYKMITTGEYPE